MRSLRMTGLLSVMAAGSLLVACDGSDPVATSIEIASRELQMLNPAGGPLPSPAESKKSYQEALSTLRSPGGEPTAAQKNAISLLTAEAEAGLAVVPMARAYELDRALTSDLRNANAILRQWRIHKTTEATALLYDPTDELAEIDETIAARDAEITMAEGAKAATDDRIQGLIDQINERMSEAEEEREIEADLRSRARGTSAVEGAELIKSARAHQRIADALEVDAEIIQARVDQLEREAVNEQLEVDRLRMQRQLLTQARADVQHRARASSEEASIASTNADEAGNELSAALDEIEAARSSGAELAQAYDEAITGLGRAASAARQAQSDSSSADSARIMLASIQQSMGDVYAARARGIAAHVELLESLVAEGGDLPGSGAHGDVLAQARTDLEEARRQAGEQYLEAKNTYSRVRIRGEDGEARLQRINDVLGNLAPAAPDAGDN